MAGLPWYSLVGIVALHTWTPLLAKHFFGPGFAGINCSHTFGLGLRRVVAGPDGICWLIPDHVSGLLMSREALRLNQPRFYLCSHHLENACAIVDV
jgi:hypothetical protein